MPNDETKGHRDLERLRGEVEGAVELADEMAVEDMGEHNVAVAMANEIHDAFERYDPEVKLIGDDEIESLAKAFYVKVLKERKAHPKNYDMRVLPWEEEADNIRDSWRSSIRFIIKTGELPREGIA